MGKSPHVTKRQQKERDDEEKANIAALQEKAAAMGLAKYKDEEIIDEVDPDMVQETFANSLLAWIPYTTAWKKAQIATESLDNLKRINNERKIARKLFALTKIGRHEEALEQLMGEVESDFAYFNKLKLKMESEGKVAYEPVGVNPFAHLGRQNRLKKAADSGVDVYAIKPEDSRAKSGKLELALEDHQPIRKRELICGWKGLDKNGLALRCGNIAMDTDVIPFKVRLCPYHMVRCIATGHGIGAPTIQTPNSQGHCIRCFQQKMNYRPGKIKPESVPGVVLATSLLQALAVTKPRTREELQAAKISGADAKSTFEALHGSHKRAYEGTTANVAAAKAVLMAALKLNATFGKSKAGLVRSTSSIICISPRKLEKSVSSSSLSAVPAREMIPKSARQLLRRRGSSIRRLAIKAPSTTAFDAMKKQKSARISSFDLLRKSPSKGASMRMSNVAELADENGSLDEEEENAKMIEESRRELMQSLGYVNPFGKLKLAIAGTAGKGKEGKSREGGSKDKRTICQWAPDMKNSKEKDWICVGKPLRHPETGKRTKYCAYHTRTCVCPHPDIPSSLITVPNSFAFCVLHHTAQLGKSPEIPLFPYPNMRLRHTVQLEATRHWAAPKRNPVPHITMTEYTEPLKAVTVTEKVFRGAKLALFLWRKFSKGRNAATKIQSVYRGYLQRSVHLQRKWDRDANRRLHAAVVLQSYARMKRDILYVQGVRRLYNIAATMMEKVARGFLTRRRERRRLAALRITHFFKRNYFVKCRDAVLMIVQLRRMMLKRVNSVLLMQCTVRRFLAKIYVANKRLWRFLENRAAKRIQRLVRYFLLRNAIFRDDPRVPTKDNRFQKLYAVRSRRLARMIFELYCTRFARRARYELCNRLIIFVQKVVRGYIGRAITRKLSALRQSLRTWCEPQFALIFMSDFLRKRMTFSSSRGVDAAMREVTPFIQQQQQRPQPPQFVRPFLPEKVRNDRSAKPDVYEAALKQWYLSEDAPIQGAEIRHFLRVYREPATGEILVGSADDFISLHPRPCRIHGRKICVKCVFLRECKMSSCHCKLFVPTVGEEGVCDSCYHGPNCHRRCPLQFSGDPKINDESLLGILETMKNPDFNKPPGIKGVSIRKAIVKPPDPDVVKYKHLLKAKRADLTRTKKETMGSTVETLLAKSQIAGQDVMETHEYWDQRPVTMLKPNPSAIFGVEAAYGLATPRAKLSEDNYWEGFWRAVAKNPNKSIRDYEEKFEHNMPVALVQDSALVYTLEGPKVYVNILMQLVKLEPEIDEDSSDFLRLIMDNVLMFERHWRKMVKDLREGVLNRNLQADPMVRDIFSSISMPRPALSARLDMVLRRLGFHKKNIGNDVNPQPYAKLRTRPESNPRSRRPSLPMTPGHDPTKSLAGLLTDTRSTSMKRSLLAAAAGSVDIGSGSDTERSRSSRSRGRSDRRSSRSRSRSSRNKADSSLAINEEMGTSRSRSRSTSVTRTTTNDDDDHHHHHHRSIASKTSGVSAASSTSSAASVESPSGRLLVGFRRTPATGTGYGEAPHELVLSVDSPSVTMAAAGGGGGSLSQRSLLGRRHGSSPSKLLPTLMSTSQSGRTLSPLRSQSRPSMLTGELSQLTMSMSQTRPITPLSPKQMSVMRLSQAMQASSLDDFKQKEEEERRRGPSRRSGRNMRRRGSETDTYVPTEDHELHATFRKQVVAPVAHLHRVVRNIEGDRYICPFPACGKSFRSKDATFAHIRTHEQKNKLQTSVPLQDSLMTAFWPTDSPWIAAPQFKERSLPPGSLPCPIDGCKAVFSTQELLKSHIRVFHSKASISGHGAGYFSFGEYLFTVPPMDPPTEAPLQFCPLHVTPFGRCTTCLEIQSTPDIPKPPFKFYNSATYDFAVKLSFMETVTGKAAHKSAKTAVARMKPILLSTNNMQLGLYIKEDPNSTRRGIALDWKGVPVAMLLDRNDDGWVAVRVLIGYMDALSRQLQLPGDFDKFHELVFASPQEVHWVRMHCISRVFDLRQTNKAVFQQLMDSHAVSKKDAYFIRIP